MIVAIVKASNRTARNTISRWLPEVSPGIFVGRVHPQGRRRMFTEFKKFDDVRVIFAPDRIVEWTSGSVKVSKTVPDADIAAGQPTVLSA